MSFSPPISNIPIALFPLKMETRFIDVPNSDKPHQLWIRVFPDIAFIQSHNPKLTQEERQDARAFKQIAHGAAEKKKEFWETLVSKYGAYRAAWVVQISEAKLAQQEQEANQSVERAEDKETSFFVKWLPDRFVFSLYRVGEKKLAYQVEGSQIREKGLTLLGENDDWLLDFEEAERIGMAIKIRLEPEDKEIEFGKVIASGFRKSGDRQINSNGLSDLLQNHQYTEGVSFLEYGTPTNNTATAKSGFSIKDEFDALKSFDYAVEGFELLAESAGGKLAQDFGIDDSTFKNIQAADSQYSKFTKLYQKATWFALGAQPLFMLFGDTISSETHQAIWEHYSQFVNAKGRHHAFKIGNQPYGILPVLNVRKPFIKDDSVEDNDKEELFNKMWTLFASLLERWLEMTNTHGDGGALTATEIPRLGDEEDTYLEVLKILSMQPTSSSYQIRPLKYNHFQARWHRWVQQLRPTPVGSIKPSLDILLEGSSTTFKKDHDNTTENRKSIVELLREILGADNNGEYNGLFNSPILSFLETESELIGFQEDRAQLIKTVEVDQEGDPRVEIISEAVDNPFSFIQEDLTAFQKFLQHLEEGTTENLLEFQYEGEISLFTDLILRSYSNAGQLYYRDVSYAPTTAEIRSIPILQIGNILKSAGTQVERGEAVLEINRIRGAENLEPIIVTAPFDGKIEKIRVVTGDEFISNFALFTLKNEEKYNTIKKELIEVGKGLLTELEVLGEDAEAKKIIQKEAIQEVLDVNSYRLDAWISSLANRRIEEMRRHQTEDDDYSNGIYFGAYGWVENLKKNTDQPVVFEGDQMKVDYQEDGGILHTPSAAQATASAIFKNAFLSYREEAESNPFTLNLTSDRIQKSTTLLKGIREGQQVEALLGYRLERFLHEHPKTEEQRAIYDGDLHREIYSLREVFPLHENVSSEQKGFVNLSVINGLKALENKEDLADKIIASSNKERKEKNEILKHYLSKLEDILDGSLDTLFYEAGYQVTQGNLSHAAAALDAIKGEIEPPSIESLKTKTSGVGISHRLVTVFEQVENEHNLQNCRALAEPVLEKWLEESIGDLQNIGCEVDLLDSEDDSLVESISIKLSDLNIGYLDLMYLSEEPVEDGASELELRIWKFAQSQKDSTETDLKYKITEFSPRNTQPLHQALETIRYARTFLDKCRPLHSEDLTLLDEKNHYSKAALDDIRDERFIPILQTLRVAANADLTEEEQLQFLVQLDIEAAKVAYLMGVSSDEAALQKEIEQKVSQIETALNAYESEEDYKTAFEYLQQIAKSLFGTQFLLLPPALVSDNFEAGIKNQDKLIGDDAMTTAEQVWGQTRIEDWVQGLAQIYESTEGFEDWLMVKKVWGQLMSKEQNHHYQIVQEPTLLEYPWIGLSKIEIDAVLQAKYSNSTIYKDKTTGESYPLSDGTYYPDACESTVLYAKKEVVLEKGKIVFGLVIEEFTEHIPDQKINTAVSFHYDAPNSESPQAILLAIHPKAMMDSDFHWEEEDLRDIIYDTIDLYKIRMVDLEAIQEYGYVLPMTHWMNIY